MLVIKTDDCRLSEVVKDIAINNNYETIQFFAKNNMYYDMHFNTPRWAGVNLLFSAGQHIIELPEKYCEINTDAVILNGGNITIIGNQANLEKNFKLSANGANGKNGRDGNNGIDGANGAAGVDGKYYFFSALVIGSNWYKNQSWLGQSVLLAENYPQRMTNKQIAKWNTNVYSVSCGVLGSDGHLGSKGGEGAKGEPGQVGGKGGKITIASKVYYGADGKNGMDGKPGNPGKDGIAGKNGEDYLEVYLAKPIYLPQNAPIIVTGRLKERRYKYFFIGQTGYSLPLPELEQTSLVVMRKPLLFSSQSTVDYICSSVCKNILCDYEQTITVAFAALFAHYKYSKTSYMQCIYEINRRFAIDMQFKCVEIEATVGLIDALENLVRLFIYNYNFNLVSKIVGLQQVMALKSFLKTSLDNIIIEILSNEKVSIGIDVKINRKITKEVEHIHGQVCSYLSQYFCQMLAPSAIRLKLR